MKKLKLIVRYIRDYYVIKNSGLFDPSYYLANNIDVRQADMNPIKHYVKYGWSEGRKPSSGFNGKYYLSTYVDVKNANLNPLVHYVRFGINEGRLPDFPTRLLIEEYD